MKQSGSELEHILHAYVDGELNQPEQRHLLVRMENDETLRERVCDLRNTKEWIKSSFEGETAPTRSLPGSHTLLWGMPVLRVAASFLLALVAFGAGWLGHSVQGQAPQQLALGTSKADMHHVILHIRESDEARFAAVLDKAEQMLQQYRDPGVQVEVIANAGGLDLMRTASSRHTDGVKRLIATYENVRFIACSLELKKLQEGGLDPTLIEGIYADQSAADYLIQRLTEGWTYIKI
jgi:intracellular sulfur oxidation DsrE/DsrF family protein